MAIYCHGCDSEDIRKISLVYESGLTVVNTTSLGTGFVQTKGRHITVTAARAAPPRRRRCAVAQIFVLIFIVLAVVSSPFWLIGIGACIFPIIDTWKWNRDVFPRLCAEWDAQYLCQRCGWVGDPRAKSVSAAPKLAIEQHETHLTE